MTTVTGIDLSGIGGVVGEIWNQGLDIIAEDVHYDVLELNRLTRILNGINYVSVILRSNYKNETCKTIQYYMANAIDNLFVANKYNLSDCLASLCYGATVPIVSKYLAQQKVGVFTYDRSEYVVNMIRNLGIIFNKLNELCSYDTETVTSVVNMLTGFKPNITPALKIKGLLFGFSQLNPEECDLGYGVGILTNTISGITYELFDTLKGSTKTAFSKTTGVLNKRLKYAPGMIFQLSSLNDDLEGVKKYNIHGKLYDEMISVRKRYKVKLDDLVHQNNKGRSWGMTDLTCRHLFDVTEQFNFTYTYLNTIIEKLEQSNSLITMISTS